MFFFKQKTAYEMRISDWSSDVCSSDLAIGARGEDEGKQDVREHAPNLRRAGGELLDLPRRQVLEQLRDHLLGDARRRQQVKPLLDALALKAHIRKHLERLRRFQAAKRIDRKSTRLNYSK